MRCTDPIHAVLERKGAGAFSLPHHASVYCGLVEMAEHDVDALIVTKDGKPVGIFSERDYARKVNLRGRSSTETLLEEVISPVSCIAPNDSVDSCLHLMTSARIRHLVAIDNGRVSGLVSIADLVNWMITAQAETIDLLSDYIALAYRQ